MKAVHLRIAEPCHEDWDAMDPGEQGRFCSKCTKHVHDLSAMTEDEANAVLRARAGGRICVRYEYDDSGSIRFRRPAALALAAVALAACTPHEPRRREVIGDVVAAPPTEAEKPTRPMMGEPPPIDQPGATPIGAPAGEIVAAQPEPMRVVKGDILPMNEPCDPPAQDAKGRLARPIGDDPLAD